jgi:hypothetical protein
MNTVRVVMSLFVGLLIVVSLAGWVWTGSHQPAPAARASRTVLGLGIVAGLVGLAAVWRRPS